MILGSFVGAGGGLGALGSDLAGRYAPLAAKNAVKATAAKGQTKSS